MKKFFTVLLISMLLLILGATLILTRSLAPYQQAEGEATELAIERANLTEINEFYWFNGDETYFTVTGTDAEGKPLIVIIQQEGAAITIVEQAEAISEEEVIQLTLNREQPARILEARIGIYENEPIWEVSFRQEDESIGYTLYKLTNGEWIRTIKNI